MSFNLLNDSTMQGLEYALNNLSLRQEVLANNIANAQTPGYAAQDVSFEDQLASIMNGDTSNVNPSATGSVVQAPDMTSNIDGNTVGLESQMSKMSQTGLMYDALTQLTADRLDILKTAITG